MYKLANLRRVNRRIKVEQDKEELKNALFYFTLKDKLRVVTIDKKLG